MHAYIHVYIYIYMCIYRESERYIYVLNVYEICCFHIEVYKWLGNMWLQLTWLRSANYMKYSNDNDNTYAMPCYTILYYTILYYTTLN